MAMAKRKSQSDHDNMVQYAANILVQKGFKNVKADISEWVQPGKITWKATGLGHIPDVTGDGNPAIIVEVETEDSIFDTHTEDQWNLFYNYAKQHSKEFWVLVPKRSETDTKTRLGQLGITAKIWAI
jgi:hypothetical protein